MLDFATRAYNHSFRIDQCVRSLLDNDFYKLLMAQYIWSNFRDVPVRFEVKNRTRTVSLPAPYPRRSCGRSSTMSEPCASPTRS